MASGIQLAPIQIKVEVAMDSLKSGLDGVKNKVADMVKSSTANIKKFGTGFKEAGESLKTIGEGMVKFGTVAVGAVAAITKVGSDWNAEVSGQKFLYDKLDVSIQKAIVNGSKHAKTIGLTSQQYKNGATNLDNYYHNMGLSNKEIAGMSDKTMTLVADLAAVTDVPFNEALDAWKSGMMGNHDAFDKLNLAVSESTINQSDYAKKIGKTYQKMTEAEKIQARFSVATQQGATASGLAAQEANQFGMQFKLLKQSVMETVGSIGEKLLPILTPLVSKIQLGVEKVRAWVEANPQLTGTILAVVGVVGVASVALGGILIVIGQIAIGIGSLALAFLALTTPVGAAVGVVIAIVAGLALVVTTNFGGIRDTIVAVMGLIGTIISTTLGFVKSLWDQDFGGIRSITETIFTTIEGIVSGVMTAIQGIIKTITAVIHGDWQGAWEGIKQVFEGIWDAIAAFLRGALTLLVQIIVGTVTGFIAAITSVTHAIYNAFVSGWRTVTGWFKSASKDPIGTLKGIASAMYNAGKNVFNSVWNGMKSVWNSLSSWVSGKIDWLKDKISFWNSGKGKINGSHYNGLSYVPFDGYNARLHKGERVLTAEENKEYTRGQLGTTGFTLNIEQFFNNTDKDIDQLMEEIAEYIKKYNIMKG